MRRNKMARKSKKEAKVTRDTLLDTAGALFSEKGVSCTSLDEIAAAAGVTRGAVYWHFDNKADLFGSLCERATTPMRAMLDTLAADPGHDPLGTLKAHALRMLTQLSEDRQLQSVFEVLLLRSDKGAELSEIIEREEESGAECRARLENILKAAVKAGQLAPHFDTSAGAIALNSYMCGMMRQWLQTRNFDLAALAPEMLEIFFTGLVSSSLPERKEPRNIRS
jgi:TetR/AcrR family acrAB operon transcriptional repressor